MNRQSGQTLAELLVAVAVIGFFAALSASPIDKAARRTAIAAATSELRAVFQRTRMLAIAHDRNVAIKFRNDADGWAWSIYEDGDGDGVRNDDISRGVDKLLEPPRRFEHKPARIGLPAQPLPDPYSGATLDTRSPVRFGTSALCSFSRVGEASNGSMILTDGAEQAVILRVYGESARVSVLRWDGRKWKESD